VVAAEVVLVGVVFAEVVFAEVVLAEVVLAEAELALYIWSLSPPPQNSSGLPGQSMLQSDWEGARTLPALGEFPQ
jgi:hypothetical protein